MPHHHPIPVPFFVSLGPAEETLLALVNVVAQNEVTGVFVLLSDVQLCSFPLE
jgi:hypothetical protein